MKKRLAFFLILIVCLTFLFIPIQENTRAWNNTNQAWNNNYESWNNKSEFVYLGGSPLGITAYAEGVIVSDYVEVFSIDGMRCPSRESGILIGDMITSVNGKKVKSVEELIKNLNNNYKPNTTIELEIVRNEQNKTISIIPAKDKALNQYKLGIMVKSDIAGVGTLTYVVPEKNSFAGLGHKISDSSLPQKDVYKKGLIYPCSIIGSVKGQQGKAGELKGYFDRNADEIGHIEKNNDYGIYGYLECFDYKNYPLIELGSKNQVTTGKAYIYTSIKGNQPKPYQIEIVKNVNQSLPSQKGLVIRVTDKELLETTGGIVQGMSGSPIVQNQKLVGAVTHVLINDPTKGYGVYIDWMINN